MQGLVEGPADGEASVEYPAACATDAQSHTSSPVSYVCLIGQSRRP